MDQTCLANSGGFAPISFPLFQGVRFGGGRIELSSSMVILLELSEDDTVRRMPNLLNYGSFREWCRHRLAPGVAAYVQVFGPMISIAYAWHGSTLHNP